MTQSPLKKIRTFGQSIWLDFIRKGMLYSGEFQSLIEEGGLLGVTSNPSIFEKSIGESEDYDDAIKTATLENKTTSEIYQILIVQDIQKAADIFLPIFKSQNGMDGFVSIEVSPKLAYDTEATVTEARMLWQLVSRPNVLIKIPATAQGIPAIEKIISEGINVNVTLLFSIDRYLEVADAYMAGLEKRLDMGESIQGITSVASFFLSRIDVAVDPILEKIILSNDGKSSKKYTKVFGQTAISSAKIAYEKYKIICDSSRFKKLTQVGGKPQRLLWASTSTKNNIDSDVKYVEALIGSETINTIPLDTFHAYQKHGNPVSRLENNLPEAKKVLSQLSKWGVDLEIVNQNLEKDGVIKFEESYEKLMKLLEVKRREFLMNSPDSLSMCLSAFDPNVQKRVIKLERDNFCSRLWQKDIRLWNSDVSIKNSLGWLHIVEKMKELAESEVLPFVNEVHGEDFKHVLVMGMGGSSLTALVFSRIFSSNNGLPVTVLDTTDPDTINSLKDTLPIAETLFIVASKSGETAETKAFYEYFFEQVSQEKGDRAGENFVAITDPDTYLVRVAEEKQFRHVFINAPDIGGRYSALSYFGLIPAALMGVDINKILIRALQCSRTSQYCTNDHKPDALVLGSALAELVLSGRDKVTLIVENSLSTFGLWLEQLMAESTGKHEKGLIPIVNEPIQVLSALSGNCKDRFFVYLTMKNSQEKHLEEIVDRLKLAKLPLVVVNLSDEYDIGYEMFRWQFATSVVGSILKINPFDQPNVQESKDNTNQLLANIDSQALVDPQRYITNSIAFYSSDSATSDIDALSYLFLGTEVGDYIAIMAYICESQTTYELLQILRQNLFEVFSLPTTMGYGPRFLHSTGQLHKGGKNSGIFLQLTADDIVDLAIPGKPYTFSTLKKCQARGDFETLKKHGRRVLRIHLGSDLVSGLREVNNFVLDLNSHPPFAIDGLSQKDFATSNQYNTKTDLDWKHL